MSKPLIRVEYGPFQFSSGFTPTDINGPNRDMNVVEHIIPNSEGGVIELLGSHSPRYQIRGFLAASNNTQTGPAGATLSGIIYIAISPDDALNYLQGLGGSGAQLLRIDSTFKASGISILYENDFFMITQATFAYEAGRGYPYYPYTIDMTKATIDTFGQSSGTTVVGYGAGNVTAPLSGLVYAMTWRSGFYNGRPIIAFGFYANTVSSGSAIMGLYNVSGPQGSGETLVAQSAPQPINSGWNYFPVNPIKLAVASGNMYAISLMTNLRNNSGVSFLNIDSSATSGTTHFHTGRAFSDGMPETFNGLGASSFSSGQISGIQLNMVIVTT